VESTERPTTNQALQRFAVRPVLLVAAGLFVLEMALAGRYGFHGDELYFMDAARHLQGGYVDQPILIPLLARASLSLFGVWLPGLRLWAALAVAATVVIAGLLARELGGRRNAQLLAALATATMPAILSTGGLLETTTLDIMFWPGLALVVVRVGRTGDCRYWLLGGLVLGVGLANKHSIGFFAVAIFLGALVRRYVGAR
jgi:4-amino-4-deoxy-L-arabinose transferase-like glycosyltransferase